MPSNASKQRIILASTSEQENYILKRKLDPCIGDLGPVQFVSVHPQGIYTAMDPNVSIVILNLPTFTSGNQAMLRNVRQIGYTGPLMVVSKVDTPETVQDVKATDNLVLLEKPYEIKDLQGIVRKFILARNVAQRIHRRYNTAQKAEVEIPGRRFKGETILFNLSRGGCYFEFPDVDDVKEVRVGDMVRMTISLNEMNRTYAMPARVVWTTSQGMTGGRGVGVEFIGRVNVQNSPFGL